MTRFMEGGGRENWRGGAKCSWYFKQSQCTHWRGPPVTTVPPSLFLSCFLMERLLPCQLLCLSCYLPHCQSKHFRSLSLPNPENPPLSHPIHLHRLAYLLIPTLGSEIAKLCLFPTPGREGSLAAIPPAYHWGGVGG